MATTYKLSYTASEVDKRLGDVATNTSNISDLQIALEDKADLSSLNNYYTKTEVDNKDFIIKSEVEDMDFITKTEVDGIELITTDDIDDICGSVI